MLHREQQATDVDVADLMVMLDRPHSALGYRTRASMPGAGRTALMGAARPKPRAARRGRRSGELSNATRWQTKKQN
jgi:hypothetical protein